MPSQSDMGWAKRAGLLITSLLLLQAASGCIALAPLGSSDHGIERGKIWFVGGAGGLGNIVGTFDVPRGLRAAGYKGAISVFAWQSVIGGTLRDQMDRPRNEAEARRLAAEIEQYMDKYPGRPVSLVALSAGTGITTWALEALPKPCCVQTVVYLSSSMSCTYDLSAAVRRVSGQLHVFHSDRDPVLQLMMPLAGSVDRDATSAGALGVEGARFPTGATAQARELYEARIRNHAYKESYAQYGYFGMHTDSTAASFIEHVVAPLILRPSSAAGEVPTSAPAPESRPARQSR